VPELRFPEFYERDAWNCVNANELFQQISNKDHQSDLPILAITQEYGAIPRELIDYNVTATKKSIQSYKVVDVGDFIISLRSFQGGIEYSTYKGICSPAYVVLRKTGEVNEQFYKQYFKTTSFIRDLTKNLEGLRDGKMISYKQFSQVPLPFPKPDEQQKIADFLSSIDELFTTQSQKLEALTAHKKGLIQQLFPAEGETAPKLRFPEFLGKGEWGEKPLKSIFSIFQGFAFSSKDSVTEGVRWLKIADVGIQHMNHNAASYLPVELKNKHKKFTVKSGDYVMALTRPILGKRLKIAPVDKVLDGALLNQRVGKLVTTENSAFVYYLLQTSKLINEIERSIAGSEPPNLSAQQIENITTYIPSEKEQKKIAECLSSVDELISSQIQQIESLKAHKKGLMQQLFPEVDKVGV
jgi:type I restriction enzyme S subunit